MKNRFGLSLQNCLLTSILPALIIACGIASTTLDCNTEEKQFQDLPVVVPFTDAKYWVLKEALKYQILETGAEITVPQGFVTDFASIPNGLCAILPSTGKYLSAAIVHDYLYWNQTCTREQADKIMDIAMMESKVEPAKRWAISKAVRTCGLPAWNANAKRKAGGELRIIPVDFRDNIPLDQTWEQFEAEIRLKVIADPSIRDPGESCDLRLKCDVIERIKISSP